MGKEHDLIGTTYPSVKKAYIQALKDSSKDDFIYVGGSTFIVADLLKYINKYNK